MRHLATVLLLVGIIDQIDNGIALVEWESSTWTLLELSPLQSPLQEGSTITLTVTPPPKASDVRTSREGSVAPAPGKSGHHPSPVTTSPLTEPQKSN
jgi:hypothetical protein